MSRLKNLVRNINYLSKHSLWDQREEDIVYITNKILDDARYEYGLVNPFEKMPNILDVNQSIDLIINSGKSFVRTGDGECKIIMGMDQPFQRYSKDLADGLKKLLGARNDNLLVGINRNYYIPGKLTNYEPFYRRHAYEYRQVYKEYIDFGKLYIDATCTAYNFAELRTDKTKKIYDKWLNAFAGKNIVIVCGNGILDKLEYDIFKYAKEKTFIYGPAKHAWEKHDEIMLEIEKKVRKDQLIVFILGMAGKVMINELAEKGYICWDAGHLAKYYDYYCRGVDGGVSAIREFVAPD